MSAFYDDAFGTTPAVALSALVPSPGPGTGYTLSGSGTEPSTTGSNSLALGLSTGFLAYTVNGLTVPGADYTVEGHFTVSAASPIGVFLTARMVGGNGYAFGYWSTNAGTYFLYKGFIGGPTSIGTFSGTPSVGTHVWQIICNGTTISATIDGVQVISVTDSTYSSAGTPGAWVFPTGTGITATEFLAKTNGSGLAAGTASSAGVTNTTASLICGVATGGTGPYTYQWGRGTTSGGESPVSGATSLSLIDSGLTANTSYYYKLTATDSASNTAVSNEVHVTTTNNTEFAPNNSHVSFSPYNWDITSGACTTNCWGSYFKFTVSGTTAVTIAVDNSRFLTVANAPILRYSIDGAAWQQTQLGQSVYTIILATGISSGSSHTVLAYWFYQSDNGEDYWTTPSIAISLLKIALDSGGSLSTSSVFSDQAIIYGDSITRGFYAGSYLAYVPGDAWEAFSSCVGFGIKTEFAQIGLAGQGWVRAGGNNTPNFPTSWNLMWSGKSRVFPAAPKFVIVNQGTNDTAQTVGTVTTAVHSWLTAARTQFTTSWLFIVIPFDPLIPTGGAINVPSEITAGFNAYQTATPDAKCKLIQISSLLTFGMPTTATTSATAQTVDGTHPNAQAHGIFGSALTDLIATAIAPGGGINGSAILGVP